MKTKKMWIIVMMVAAVIAGGRGASWAQPRQVSNEPSTENFSGASERNWSSISFQAAYAGLLNGSGVSGYGIGANAAFIPRNRLGRASLGLDADCVVAFLSTKAGKSAGTDVVASLGPVAKAFPVNAASLSLAIRPGISVSSDGTSESDFSLSEALMIDVYPNPEIGIGLAPTITQIFAKEMVTLFHLSLMISFNY